MTPRTAAAVRTAPREASRIPSPRPQRTTSAERLRPVATSPTPEVANRERRRIRPVAVAIGLVVVSLLGVVGGNMQLASGKLRLEQVDPCWRSVESAYAASLAAVAAETSPQALARVGGLQAPRAILPIPSVSLSHRLAAPTSTAPCCSLTAGR